MSAAKQTELERFHEFVGRHLGNGGADLSPEEAIKLWRAQNPTSEELSKSVADIEEVIADIESGDSGRDATEILTDLRRKYGFGS